ncbi:hypothetical protein AVEN_60030-1 [Araneus ventricosus]|uniref:Apple domain-containing protein n=1 Tax=Araneus ventricosus TaxID=182803 RepID=A0A4Y2CBH0_ARAVE|nr:hypothetical protein AVEN_60030-1 [Araneus ventricosus]
MKIFLAFLFCLEIIHYVSAKCSRGGMESFILSTNALPSPSSYKNIPGSSLVECTRTCLEDANCHSFIFLRSRNETECRLTTNILADSKKRQEQLLMPTLGTYYMEKICLKGACDRLFVAESLRGMELDGYNDRIISNSSRLSCLESCLNNKAFICKSIEFDSKTGECRLSRHDRFDRKTDFRKSLSASMEYFDVTCPYEQQMNCMDLIQFISEPVDIYGNEVADNLAKQGTAEPLCSTPSLTFDEIYSIRKNKDLKTWRVPPSHDWYKRSSPGGSICLSCDRADQTALSRFVSGHLRSCSFSHGNKVFPVCAKCGVASESPEHILSCLRLSRETFETDPLLALDFLRVSGLMDGV